MALWRTKKKKKRIRATPLVNVPGSHNDCELFQIFKNHAGRTIHKWLHYFEIYDTHFRRFKNKEVHILEFGIFKGGSLQMWKEYFGDRVKIYGVDIKPDCKRFEEENIEIFIGDQNDRKFLRELSSKVPRLDIVIDDGGHTSKQQITTFEEVYPHISPTGVYLVEDTHTNYWPKYNEGVKESFIQYARGLTDLLHAWHVDKENHHRFALPHNLREGTLKVPDFTLQTRCINFYDSVVVFQKHPAVTEPYHCLGGQEEGDGE